MTTGVLKSRFAQNVLPLATSLGVHAAIVIVGVLALRSLVVLNLPELEVQATTPDAMIAPDLPPDFTRPPSLRPSTPRMIDQPDDQPPLDSEFTRSDAPALREGGDRDADGEPVVPMIGPSASAFTRNVGKPGTGDGGPRSGTPFGIPGGAGRGGRDYIFIPPPGVRSVAYVCDASGSMIDKFDALRHQLDRGVEGLKPIQSFNVIFFHDQRAAALSGAALLPGVPVNKRRAIQFLDDVAPSGATDPLPALELALRQQPELIWLLTDGDFPDNAAVLEFLRRRNPGGKVRINTIAFVARDEGYEKVLQTIAAENRGEFRYVSERELD